MNNGTHPAWQVPSIERLEGKHVLVTRVNPDVDVNELFEVSHAKDEYKELWKYMNYGPFRDETEMKAWLSSIRDSRDPIFYTVFSKDLKKRVGMYSMLNVNTRHGRVELGNVWYSPLVQKTIVNTEVCFLFFSYLFDELKYRRIEWKCDEKNIPSKRAALRLGFSFEGVFRQHMIVKGRSRDTAWYSIVEQEWAEKKKNFKRYFDDEGLSLTKLNQVDVNLLP
jgi:RimJ/RimL family protein N-acetyltransferase